MFGCSSTLSKAGLLPSFSSLRASYRNASPFGVFKSTQTFIDRRESPAESFERRFSQENITFLEEEKIGHIKINQATQFPEKRMEELIAICKTKLDDADLSLFLSPKKDEITLEFVVGGTREVVVFKCSNILTLSLTKDYEDTNNAYWIGGTSVSIIDAASALSKTGWSFGNTKLPDWWYRVSLEGGIALEIVCENFLWEYQGTIRE